MKNSPSMDRRLLCKPPEFNSASSLCCENFRGSMLYGQTSHTMHICAANGFVTERLASAQAQPQGKSHALTRTPRALPTTKAWYLRVRFMLVASLYNWVLTKLTFWHAKTPNYHTTVITSLHKIFTQPHSYAVQIPNAGIIRYIHFCILMVCKVRSSDPLSIFLRFWSFQKRTKKIPL